MSVQNDPTFFIIIDFFEKFSDLCGIEKPDTKQLKDWLDNNEDVHPELIDLHLKLMRKLRKVVQPDKWERALIKFCYLSCSNQDAWEIERFGYKKASLAVKLRILKVLLESQFDANAKFKNAINSKIANDLRAQPVGRDNLGNAYWYSLDKKCNILIFQENIDDEKWRLVASSREEFIKLIENLKNNIPILPSEEDDPNEDDSSQDNVCIVDEIKTEAKLESNKNNTEEDRVSLKITLKKPTENENTISSEEQSTSKVTNQSPVKITISTKSKLKKKHIGRKNRKRSKRLTESDSDVGEEIVGPSLLVQGEGSGRDCEANPEFSEIIEENTIYFLGEGNGSDCLVGNEEKPTSTNTPKTSFFFGPGCIKSGGFFNFSSSKSAISEKPKSPENVIKKSSISQPDLEEIKKDGEDLVKKIEQVLKSDVKCKPGILTTPIKIPDIEKTPESSSSSSINRSYLTGVTSFCKRLNEAIDSETHNQPLIQATTFTSETANKSIEDETFDSDLDEIDQTEECEIPTNVDEILAIHENEMEQKTTHNFGKKETDLHSHCSNEDKTLAKKLQVPSCLDEMLDEPLKTEKNENVVISDSVLHDKDLKKQRIKLRRPGKIHDSDENQVVKKDENKQLETASCSISCKKESSDVEECIQNINVQAKVVKTASEVPQSSEKICSNLDTKLIATTDDKNSTCKVTGQTSIDFERNIIDKTFVPNEELHNKNLGGSKTEILLKSDLISSNSKEVVTQTIKQPDIILGKEEEDVQVKEPLKPASEDVVTVQISVNKDESITLNHTSDTSSTSSESNSQPVKNDIVENERKLAKIEKSSTVVGQVNESLLSHTTVTSSEKQTDQNTTEFLVNESAFAKSQISVKYNLNFEVMQNKSKKETDTQSVSNQYFPTHENVSENETKNIITNASQERECTVHFGSDDLNKHKTEAESNKTQIDAEKNDTNNRKTEPEKESNQSNIKNNDDEKFNAGVSCTFANSIDAKLLDVSNNIVIAQKHQIEKEVEVMKICEQEKESHKFRTVEIIQEISSTSDNFCRPDSTENKICITSEDETCTPNNTDTSILINKNETNQNAEDDNKVADAFKPKTININESHIVTSAEVETKSSSKNMLIHSMKNTKIATVNEEQIEQTLKEPFQVSLNKIKGDSTKKSCANLEKSISNKKSNVETADEKNVETLSSSSKHQFDKNEKEICEYKTTLPLTQTVEPLNATNIDEKVTLLVETSPTLDEIRPVKSTKTVNEEKSDYYVDTSETVKIEPSIGKVDTEARDHILIVETKNTKPQDLREHPIDNLKSDEEKLKIDNTSEIFNTKVSSKVSKYEKNESKIITDKTVDHDKLLQTMDNSKVAEISGKTENIASTSKVTASNTWIPPIMTTQEKMNPFMDKDKPQSIECGLDLSKTSTYQNPIKKSTLDESEEKKEASVPTKQKLVFSVNDLLSDQANASKKTESEKKFSVIKLKREKLQTTERSRNQETITSENEKKIEESYVDSNMGDEQHENCKSAQKSNIPQKIEDSNDKKTVILNTSDSNEEKSRRIENSVESTSITCSSVTTSVPQKLRRGRKSDPIKLSERSLEDVPALQDAQPEISALIKKNPVKKNEIISNESERIEIRENKPSVDVEQVDLNSINVIGKTDVKETEEEHIIQEITITNKRGRRKRNELVQKLMVETENKIIPSNQPSNLSKDNDNIKTQNIRRSRREKKSADQLEAQELNKQTVGIGSKKTKDTSFVTPTESRISRRSGSKISPNTSNESAETEMPNVRKGRSRKEQKISKELHTIDDKIAAPLNTDTTITASSIVKNEEGIKITKNTKGRKRRMPDEHQLKNSSSETFMDLIKQNSSDEKLEPSGKRVKLPSRYIDTNVRRQVELKLEQEFPPSSEDDHSLIRSKSNDQAMRQARSPKSKRRSDSVKEDSFEDNFNTSREQNLSTSLETIDKVEEEPSGKRLKLPENKFNDEKTKSDNTEFTQGRARRGKQVNKSKKRNLDVSIENKKTDAISRHGSFSNDSDTFKGFSQSTQENDSIEQNKHDVKNRKLPIKKNKRKSIISDVSVLEKSECSTENNKNEQSLAKEEPNKAKVTPRKRAPLLSREVDPSLVIDTTEITGPVRQSRRIQQLKVREEADRRKQEEILLAQLKADSEKKKRQDDKDLDFVPTYEDDSEEDLKNIKRRGKGKAKHDFKWHSNTESESSEEDQEDEEEHEASEDNRSALFKSDHEFSCESDVGEEHAVPTKRARTVKKEDVSESEDDNPDHVCQKCKKSDHPEWILLCDNCDKGYHCSCLTPVLFLIPEGDWFCPACQHHQLIKELEMNLEKFDVKVKAFEIAEKVRENERALLEKEEKERKAEEAKQKQDATRKKSKSLSKSPNGSTENSSDDEPIYKFRRRNQVNSYRFNEFDDLIDSAIKRDMKEKDDWGLDDDDDDINEEEENGAGNKGRGKDISTIIEAEKEQKRRQSMLDEDEKESHNENEQQRQEESYSDSEDELIKKSCKKIANKKKRSKPKRRLNQLDVSSEDEGSDQSFKAFTDDESEENEIASSGDSESSLELAALKRKLEKGGRRYGTRRRQTRMDQAFIDDNDSDEFDRFKDAGKKKKKKSSDSELELSENEGSDDASESEDIDSEELCDDTGSSTTSEYRWSKRKKKSKATKGASLTSGKSPRKCFVKKKSNRDEDKSFRIGTSKKKPPSEKGSDESETDMPVRRTRGRQMHYIEDDFESSDDGIKPGVRRPDTPPEERELFIKKQEEIKRMLAEKNTEAAKALATPTLLKVDQPVEPPLDNISIIPASVIENAKALDMDIKKSASVFDDLPDDFNPDDMDDKELAKMMEEEDFANHQLKLAGDMIRKKRAEDNKKPIVDPSDIPTKLVKVTKTPKKKDFVNEGNAGQSILKRDLASSSSVIVQDCDLSKPNPHSSKSSSVHMPQTGVVPSNSTMFQNQPRFVAPHGLQLHMYSGSMRSGVPTFMQNPIYMRPGAGVIQSDPQNPELQSIINLGRQQQLLSNPLTEMSRMSTPIQSHETQSVNLPQSVPDSIIPTTVAEESEGLVKKRGRRKKITPKRDDLPKNDPAQSLMQMKPEFAVAGKSAVLTESSKISYVAQPQHFDDNISGSGAPISRTYQRNMPVSAVLRPSSPKQFSVPKGSSGGPLTQSLTQLPQTVLRHPYAPELGKSHGARVAIESNIHSVRLPMGPRPPYNRMAPALISSAPSRMNYRMHPNAASSSTLKSIEHPRSATQRHPLPPVNPNFPGTFPPHQFSPYFVQNQPPMVPVPPQHLQIASNRDSSAHSAGSSSPYQTVGNRTPHSYHAASSGDEETSSNVAMKSSGSAGEFSGLVSYFSSQQDDLNS